MTQVTDEMFRVFYEGYRDAGPEQFSLSSYKVRNALKYLFDAKLISLPVNEAAIRESVVREAIAMFEYSDRYHYTGKAVCENLRSILTPKDRAEELADEWEPIKRGQLPAHIERYVRDFARWLIEREGANG